MRVFLNIDEKDRELGDALGRLLEPHEIELVLPEPSPAAFAFSGSSVLETLQTCHGFLYLVTTSAPQKREITTYYQALDLAENHAEFVLLPVTTTGRFFGLHGLRERHWIAFSGPLEKQVVGHIADALKGKESNYKNHRPCCAFAPFSGMAPMTQADTAFFTGRTPIVTSILESIRVNERQMMTLIGHASTGKTSLALAGVMGTLLSQRWPANTPAAGYSTPTDGADKAKGRAPEPAIWPSYLRDSRGWAHVTMKPGGNPLRELVHALIGLWLGHGAQQPRMEHVDKWAGYLRHGGTLAELLHAVRQNLEMENLEAPWRIFLFIDQFEEVYTKARTGEGVRFSELLAEALEDPSLVVLSTLNAEDYGRLQSDAHLFPKVRSFDVVPLNEAAILSSVETPLQILGSEFEHDAELKSFCVAAASHPNGLALMRVQLAGSYEEMCRGGDNKLRIPDKSYAQHLEKGLAHRADHFLDQHSHLTDTVRRLLVHKLVHVHADGRLSTRRLVQSKCTLEEWELLKKMARPNPGLVQLSEKEGEPAAEIVSRVVIEAWPRLATWTAEEHDFKVWQLQIVDERAKWEQAGQVKSQLLEGVPLHRAAHWLSVRKEFIPPDDRDYVAASRTYSERQKGAQVRNLRLFGVLMLTVALGLTVAGMAMRSALVKTQLQAKSAKHLEILARINEGKAYTERNDALLTQSQILADLSGKIVETGDAVTGMLLAMEALPDANNPTRKPYVVGAEAALYQSLYSRRERHVLYGHDHFVSSVAFHPKGTHVLSASHDNTARIWNAATGRQHVVLSGHKGKLWGATYSADGAQVATASADGTARIFDSVTGRVQHILSGHKGGVIRAVFSPDGRKLVTASSDETARIWDVATGKQQILLKGHVNFVVGAKFNNYGNRVVTTSYDLTARIWNARTGDRVALLSGHKGYVVDADFNYDDTLVVTASNDGTARIWDAWSGALLKTLAGHRRAVYSARFSPDGARVLTASGDHTARVWDPQTGDVIVLLQGHERPIYSAEYSRDGSKIITASLDKTARIWDAKTGEELAVLRGHESYVRAALSPDATVAVTGSGDRSVRLWDATPGGVSKPIDVHKSGVTRAVMHPLKPVMLSAASNGDAALWDTENGRLIRMLPGHGKTVYGAEFSANGKWLLTVSLDNSTRLWDTESGSQIAVMRGHQTSVNGGFSPNGDQVITFSPDFRARLWSVATGKELTVYKGHEGLITSARFSPDGEVMATASADRTVRLWDIERGVEVLKLLGHDGGVTDIAFSPDGELILTASEDKTARVWNVRTGRQIFVLSAGNGIIKNIAFSPDSTRIVVATHESTARIYSVRTHRQIAVLRHEFNVNSATFSPDGKKIITASDDGTARLWDGWTGALLAVLRGHKNVVTSALFSPKGDKVTTASADGKVRIWPVFSGTQELLSFAKSIVPRCLNAQQRKKLYLLPTPPRWCAKFENTQAETLPSAQASASQQKIRASQQK